ncbi:YjbQ family protein [bacterium C-53]|nr:YjbQ family protein [Lachnospiraceae bacterium]NBI03366.1 YjbQ family protein [Lachnospiraceae bacterium]RKJ09901.1 YjbQ family protein [bacterium C-53]
MVKLQIIERMSHKPEEYMLITEDVHRIVEASGIEDGLAVVVTAHTTTGIIVNEALPCVESDISDMLERMAPLDADYAHAHFLPSYGATGNNSQGHLKSLVCGNSCMFPVIGGKIVCGGAQDIYLVDFDGPQKRKIYVEVMGEPKESNHKRKGEEK